MKPMKISDGEYDRQEFERRGMFGNIKMVKITPAMAQRWLDHNGINRTLRPDHAETFADLSREGMWNPVAGLFHIASDGTLLNGQHRCKGIADSGITVYSYVVFGLARGVYDDLDQQVKKRSMKDLLNRELKYRDKFQAIANAIWDIRHAKWAVVARKTLDLYEEFKIDIEWAWDTFKIRQSVFSAGVIACFAYAHACPGLEKKVEKFADELLTQVGREPKTVAGMLYNACLRTSKGGAKGRHLLTRKTFTALRLYCEGDSAKRLGSSADGINWAREMLDDKPIDEGPLEDSDVS
jgi:hypothetical protein